jgi:hypothetical protein
MQVHVPDPPADARTASVEFAIAVRTYRGNKTCADQRKSPERTSSARSLDRPGATSARQPTACRTMRQIHWTDGCKSEVLTLLTIQTLDVSRSRSAHPEASVNRVLPAPPESERREANSKDMRVCSTGTLVTFALRCRDPTTPTMPS